MTTADPVPPPPPPRPPRLARIWWVQGPLLLAGLALVVASIPWRAPYAILAPGSARPVSPLIRLGTDQTYDHPGQLLFVTVSVTARPNPPTYAQALLGWLLPHDDVYPDSVVTEGRSGAAEERYQTVLMSSSRQSAAYQALKLLGYPVREVASGAFVSSIEKGSPADGPLQAGDTIIEMDGGSINNIQALHDFLKQHHKGDVVDVAVDRLGVGTVHSKVTLGEQQGPDGPVAYLGIMVETRPRYVLPFQVDILTGDVGGPSAGLAFTLALIDKLSKADITKGHKVAVTGTMEVDGSVGDVGGVAQKTVAVRSAGADVFLVPADEYAEAVRNAGPHLRVIKVTTLDDALAALRSLPAKTGK